jgi:hypothetical protein
VNEPWSRNGDSSRSTAARNEDVGAQLLRPFARVGSDRTQAILNVLVESTFFYRDDNPDLFAVLQRNARLFRAFFESTFGWDLFLDPFVAKLNKPQVYNASLRPRQRHVFQLTRKGEYVVFIILLEFQELQAEQQNVDLSSTPELRFLLRDFLEFLFQRIQEELGAEAPSDEEVLSWARKLFDKLVLHRFLVERERSGRAESEGLAAAFSRNDDALILYGMLPGLRCYRPDALALDVLAAPDSATAGDSTGGDQAADEDGDMGRAP